MCSASDAAHWPVGVAGSSAGFLIITGGTPINARSAGHLQQHRLGLRCVRRTAGKRCPRNCGNVASSAGSKRRRMRLRVNCSSTLVGSSDERHATVGEPGPNVGRPAPPAAAVVGDALAHPSGGHTAQTRQTTAPTQGQQQRFHLVIGMLCKLLCF